MGFFLLIDEQGPRRNCPAVSVVGSENYLKSTEPVVRDYIVWSKVGDVLQLDPERYLIRLGSYRSVLRPSKKE